MSKVKQGQSFVDKVTELTGSRENVVKMAVLNGVSVTGFLSNGVSLNSVEITNTEMVKYFKVYGSPATASKDYKQDQPTFEGIGKMEIGKTFIVR